MACSTGGCLQTLPRQGLLHLSTRGLFDLVCVIFLIAQQMTHTTPCTCTSRVSQGTDAVQAVWLHTAGHDALVSQHLRLARQAATGVSR
jgi:hypothetical protein